MSFQNILFDLDGTVIDSYEGITKCLAIALEYFGIHVEDRNILRVFLGPPLLEQFMEYASLTKEQAEFAIVKYREQYFDWGYKDCAVYPGVERLLKKLRENGKRVMLATAKPTQPSVKILEELGMDVLFDFMGGSELNGKRHTKTDVIRYVMEENSLDPAQTIMVGDRRHDIEGAKNMGIASIGVLYGFGSRAELEAAGADYIAADADEIFKIVL